MKTIFKSLGLLFAALTLTNQISAQGGCFGGFVTCTSTPCQKISNGSFSDFGFLMSYDYTPYNDACLTSYSAMRCWDASHGGPSMTSIGTNPALCTSWQNDVALKAYGSTSSVPVLIPFVGWTYPAGYSDGVFQAETITKNKLYFLSYKYKVANLTPPYWSFYSVQKVVNFGALSEFNCKFVVRSSASNNFCATNVTVEPAPVVTVQQTVDQMTTIAPSGIYATRTACIKANNSYDAIWFYPRQNAGPTNSRISLDDISMFEVGAGRDTTVTCDSVATLGEGCIIPGAIYSWAPTTGLSNPNILNPTVSFTSDSPVIYTLTITYNGCSLKDEVVVTPRVGAGRWDYTSANANKTTQGFDIARDVDGSVYVCGTFQISATFPAATPVNITGAGTTPRSAYLAKFNACGDLLWINYENGLGWSEGRSLVVDPSSNTVFMAGASNGSIRFQSTAASPGIAGVAATPFATTCYYISRFNKATGAYVNAYAATPATGYVDYEINSIAMRKTTVAFFGTVYNIYACGSASNTVSNSRNVQVSNITAFSAAYIPVWERFGTVSATGIAQAWDIGYNPIANNLYITGDYQLQLSFQTASVPAFIYTVGAKKDAFICTLNPTTGDAFPVLFRTLGATAGEMASGTALAVDGAGEVFFTGYYSGSLASTYGFPSSPMPGSAGRTRAYCLRTNGTSLMWGNQIPTALTGNSIGTGIALNKTQVFVAGMFEGGNLVIGAGFGTYITSPGKRMFIATLDKSLGSVITGNSTKSLISSSNHITTKIVSDNNFYTYTTGSYSGEMDYSFGTPTSGPLNSSPFVNQNMFVVRNETGSSNSFRLINNENSTITTLTRNDIEVYPNPTSGNFILRSNSALKNIFVYDINGKVVFEMKDVNDNYINIDLSNEATGIYIIRLTDDKSSTVKKVVKQ